MLKNRIAFGLVVLLLLFASCTPNPASTPLPTETQLPSPSETPIILTPTATETTAPTSTETPTPDTATPTATLTATQPSAGSGILSGYLDDRSTPSGLMLSYVNALNRKEYLRAYSYWENPQQDLGSYEQYQQGYQDTASVEAELGQISGADSDFCRLLRHASWQPRYAGRAALPSHGHPLGDRRAGG
jgi:hypothetical protein